MHGVHTVVTLFYYIITVHVRPCSDAYRSSTEIRSVVNIIRRRATSYILYRADVSNDKRFMNNENVRVVRCTVLSAVTRLIARPAIVQVPMRFRTDFFPLDR